MGNSADLAATAKPPRVKKCCGSAWGESHKIGCTVAMGRERYRADRSRGVWNPNPSPTIVVCISLTERELAELDDAAENAQMSRSHFLREAYKHFVRTLEARELRRLEGHRARP